ncbi:MAG: hypothetical protein ACKOYH_00930, partial [Cyanobium sp.]
ARTRTSSAVKMAIGMIILGLGFVVMYLGQSQAAGGVKIGAQWLFFVYALHTLGELCLSPIGLFGGNGGQHGDRSHPFVQRPGLPSADCDS